MAKKVLIVEDEESLIELLGFRLKKEGYSVETAPNGIEGLKKAKEFAPDIVLLDVVMPGMDGLSVCKELRRFEKTKDTPVIILSASGLRDLDASCREAGATCVMRKPYEGMELLRKIEELLHQ